MKTQIIATIGPASEELETMQKMAAAGMTVARINTKYGSKEQYEKIIQNAKTIGGIKVLFDVKFKEVMPWLKEHDFDLFALSFAENAAQIQEVRDYFAPREMKIIVKIEDEKGIENIDELISASDGVMVARGDLGKNISYEKVPIAQKVIIKKCNEACKMVITATEMLLSMTKSEVPERAEASDVANAVLDGTDYVMLSEETALGEHPVLVVETMAKIIEETEKDLGMIQGEQLDSLT